MQERTTIQACVLKKRPFYFPVDFRLFVGFFFSILHLHVRISVQDGTWSKQVYIILQGLQNGKYMKKKDLNVIRKGYVLTNSDDSAAVPFKRVFIFQRTFEKR